MSDVVWSARRENKMNTVEQLKKIKLTLDDTGQYQHDDVIKFTEQLKQVAKEQFKLRGQLAALQRAFDDYEESAFSVDADSSRSKTKKKTKKKKDDGSSRGRNKHRSKSRGRSKSTDERKVKNKCKHCKEERPYTGKHEEDKCFYNKKDKGWRPSKICKEMDITFKHRQEYSSDMGGFASSASE
jgi:hypothetical protein